MKQTSKEMIKEIVEIVKAHPDLIPPLKELAQALIEHQQ